MKQLFFFNAGDIMSQFMQASFNDDIESTLKDNSLAFLNSQLDLAVRSKPHTDSILGYEQYLQENFSFEAMSQQSFYLTAFNVLLFNV